MQKYIVGGLTALIVIAGLIWTTLSRKPAPEPPQVRHKLTIAVPATPPPGLVFIAYENGYFSAQGLDVTLHKLGSGKASLKAVLEGQAEMGATSENPIMHAALKDEPVQLLATILSTTKNYVVLARKDHGIAAVGDLKSKKVGVTFGTNSEFLLEAMLTLNGLGVEDIEKVHFKPTDLVETIVGGQVSAISAWNPHILKARKQLPDNHIVFYGSELYTATFNLAALDSYVDAHPDVIERALRALLRAAVFVKENPEQARAVLAKHIKLSKPMIDELWEIFNYDLTLDQSLITTMESQAKWAIRHGLSERESLPNFLDVLYLDGMKTVKPAVVTVIH